MSMFCYQCQEAARGTGCTVRAYAEKLTMSPTFKTY